MPGVTHSNLPISENVFVNGGSVSGGGLTSALGVEDSVGISDMQARSIISGQADLIALGEDPETYEALEQFGGGSKDGTSPTTGNDGVMAAPGSDEAIGADALYQQDIPRPTSEWVVVLSHVNPRVTSATWDALVELGSTLGRPIVIQSAERRADYNKRVGGATKSLHIEGKAVDVLWGTTSVQSRMDMIQKAVNAGFTGIGCYDNFMHVDIGDKRSWGPNGSYTGQFEQYKAVLKANGYPHYT
jgi:hypothetical protein|tara:strand:- start:366 stop:1097 length:732 start_codon:yes stop_codon:yes gene_type:complete